MPDVHIAHETALEGVVVSRAVELATELSDQDRSVVAVPRQLVDAGVTATSER
jgi:hypothetical protein